MNLIKCANEHFYDADKFLFCPHCANQITGANDNTDADRNQGQISTKPPDSQNINPVREDILGRTVGWLVCIEGVIPGESFTLREGSNYIGRAANMDVCLLYEPTVSREKHAVITYDPTDNCCLLSSPEHPDRTFCNGKTVTTKKVLKDRDFITLGECSLLFIALCDSSFRWPAQNTEQQEVTL